MLTRKVELKPGSMFRCSRYRHVWLITTIEEDDLILLCLDGSDSRPVGWMRKCTCRTFETAEDVWELVDYYDY